MKIVAMSAAEHSACTGLQGRHRHRHRHQHPDTTCTMATSFPAEVNPNTYSFPKNAQRHGMHGTSSWKLNRRFFSSPQASCLWHLVIRVRALSYPISAYSDSKRAQVVHTILRDLTFVAGDVVRRTMILHFLGLIWYLSSPCSAFSSFL
jgi:hypothetical protein